MEDVQDTEAKQMFTCPEKSCGRQFVKAKSLHMHMVRSHSDNHWNIKGERITKANAPYACALCPARYTSKASLGSHMRRIHNEDQYAPRNPKEDAQPVRRDTTAGELVKDLVHRNGATAQPAPAAPPVGEAASLEDAIHILQNERDRLAYGLQQMDENIRILKALL